MATHNYRIVSSPEPEPTSPSLAPSSYSTDLQPSPGDVLGSNKSAHNVEINDPDTVPILPKTGASAPDIQFFFDKSGSKTVCKECR